ncbi:amidohydrolase family protein, partial [Vibrio parahaemolyticus V-223/04]
CTTCSNWRKNTTV